LFTEQGLRGGGNSNSGAVARRSNGHSESSESAQNADNAVGGGVRRTVGDDDEGETYSADDGKPFEPAFMTMESPTFQYLDSNLNS